MQAIRFHSLAKLEINEARNRSRMVTRFVKELEDRIELIRLETMKFSGMLRGARQTILPRLPYSIIYMDEPTEIFIVAYSHYKKKPGYWKRRLKS